MFEAVMLKYDRSPTKKDSFRLSQAHHLSLVVRSTGARKSCYERDQINSADFRLLLSQSQHAEAVHESKR